MKTIKLKALEVVQPIGRFYIGVIDAKTLRDMTFSDVRKLGDDSGRDLDNFIGIQRPLNDSRVKKINQYIDSVDATFPNSIIVSINDKDIVWDSSNSELKISYKDETEKNNLAKILDGQHRIAGFGNANEQFLDDKERYQDFQLMVTIFVDSDISTQANIFATVNLAQTKVNRSLVYDLESLAHSRSPEKTCHDIAVLMNKSIGPFHRRIKRLGVATPGLKNELITQASFVQRLLDLISRNPKQDRNYYLAKIKGGELAKKYTLEDISEESYYKYPFRQSFIERKDSVIASNISNYFSAVDEMWPNAWDQDNKNSSLNKTIGFFALMRVLGVILKRVILAEGHDSERVLSQEEYLNILDGGILDEEVFEMLEPNTKTSKVIFDLIISNLALDEDEDENY